MKRLLLCLLLFPLAVSAQVPSYPARLDLQSPSRTFTLKWAAGSSPVLATYIYDGGRAFTNLSGWTGYVYVAVTPTAGVYVAASPVGSNRVNFSFTASQTATVGVFGVEVVLGNGTNTYRWGTGSLALSNSPALLGAGTVPLTGIFNWDLYTFTGTQPPLTASYTNPLAGDVTGVPGATVIADGVVGTNNLDAEVRGLLATTGIDTNSAAWTGLVASVSAAQATANTASSTGTAAYALANTASSTGTAAYALAAAANTLAATNAFTAKISHTHAYKGPGQTNYVRLIHDGGSGAPDFAGIRYGASESAPMWGSLNVGTTEIYGYMFVSNKVFIGNPYGSLSPVSETNFVTVAGSVKATAFILSGGGTYSTSDGAHRFGGYLPTDFALLTTLSTGGYLRITSGAVTSNSMPGTRGEYRRSTTNAYFHDGSQWVTWSVSTNFSH